MRRETTDKKNRGHKCCKWSKVSGYAKAIRTVVVAKKPKEDTTNTVILPWKIRGEKKINRECKAIDPLNGNGYKTINYN